MRWLAMVLLAAFSGEMAAGPAADLQEVRLIRSLSLRKMEKSIVDPPGYSGTVAVFLDDRGRCRKAVVRNAGNDAECFSAGYYDARGRLVLAVFHERLAGAQGYVFYGVTRFQEGKPVRHDTRLGKMTNTGPHGRFTGGAAPVISGYRGGIGRLLRIFSSAPELLRHYRYPAGFVDRGHDRQELPTEPRPAHALGQGIPVRATADNTGVVVGRLEAGAGLTVMNALMKAVPGKAAEPWVFVCYSDRSRGDAGYEGWVQGIFVEIE